MLKPGVIGLSIFGILFCVLLATPSQAQIKRDAVDTLVLCNPDLQTALAPWVEYRRRQGHRIAIRFSKPTVEQNRKLIAEYAKGDRLENIVLVGDAGDRWLDPRKLVPTNLVPAKVNLLFGSEPNIASDNPYGDLDEDGVPELAVGRLTADTPEELTQTVNRIIRYEQEANGQLWQRKINLVAGVGGLGRMVDSIIENTTRQIVKELIPAGYQTSMTYGSWTSPYCPDPRRFSETAIGRFNEGCLFWVYCGHGNRGQLDRIMLPDQNHRILDCELVDQLDCKSGSPIAICLACYTGAHDGDEDCLAEHMMRQPNGPVAVVCGSRVTMPYAMSILSVEMMNEFFRGECQTLGQLMLRAKQRMAKKPDGDNKYRQSLDALGQTFSPMPKLLDAECREHMHLMQLIGDPLMRLKRPTKLSLGIKTPTPDVAVDDELPTFSAGDTIALSGATDKPGTLLVELAYQRGRLRHRPSIRHEYDSSDKAFAKIHEDYLKAHDSVVLQKQLQIGKGGFEVDLQVPAGCKGECDVRAMLLGAEDAAIDSVPVRVLSDRQSRKLKQKAIEESRVRSARLEIE
ncbi:C25 family cysteine peptidase [Mariniblastus fucicola]|uniref:Gingipain R2 n=1 Tax=Mariniblastus fucicola TaxID=980251 RepID=A0A5B9PNS5_9BACT|nr:C25 family cysteine peptidase [Mariniblastus fucicola]QEG24201.1 Gingipain R2 precursor [Mariniblastus fucicola]